MSARNTTNAAPEGSDPKTQVGELIADAMRRKGWSIRDLASKVDMTYEHARRIVRGEGIPSKYILKQICDALGIEFKAAEKAATSDRILKKFGDVPLELAGRNPELAPIEKDWQYLSDDQKQDAINIIHTWAKRNKAASKN